MQHNKKTKKISWDSEKKFIMPFLHDGRISVEKDAKISLNPNLRQVAERSSSLS